LRLLVEALMPVLGAVDAGGLIPGLGDSLHQLAETWLPPITTEFFNGVEYGGRQHIPGAGAAIPAFADIGFEQPYDENGFEQPYEPPYEPAYDNPLLWTTDSLSCTRKESVFLIPFQKSDYKVLVLANAIVVAGFDGAQPQFIRSRLHLAQIPATTRPRSRAFTTWLHSFISCCCSCGAPAWLSWARFCFRLPTVIFGDEETKACARLTARIISLLLRSVWSTMDGKSRTHARRSGMLVSCERMIFRASLW